METKRPLRSAIVLWGPGSSLRLLPWLLPDLARRLGPCFCRLDALAQCDLLEECLRCLTCRPGAPRLRVRNTPCAERSATMATTQPKPASEPPKESKRGSTLPKMPPPGPLVMIVTSPHPLPSTRGVFSTEKQAGSYGASNQPRAAQAVPREAKPASSLPKRPPLVPPATVVTTPNPFLSTNGASSAKKQSQDACERE